MSVVVLRRRDAAGGGCVPAACSGRVSVVRIAGVGDHNLLRDLHHLLQFLQSLVSVLVDQGCLHFTFDAEHNFGLAPQLLHDGGLRRAWLAIVATNKRRFIPKFLP